LSQLAGVVGLVAVISGRPVTYLAEHLGGLSTRVRLHGLYGLERSSPDGVRSAPDAERWRPAVDEAATRTRRDNPRIHVEHKGLTVTVHYRAVPDEGAAVEAAARALAGELGLVAHSGKMSVELRPPLAVDKGTVVNDLAASLSVVAFAGDDIGDLPAYAALRRKRQEGLVTLAIAAGGPETPHLVAEAADLVVDGPDGFVQLLETVVSRLRR
jgi:trehalose 6-phosphate phosphatase